MERQILLDTLTDAGVDADEIDYVEAHGTGTPVGDPIEVNAVAAIFCKDRKKPLFLGTVKGNIGHTEAKFRYSADVILKQLHLQFGK
ncbi:fatty acid synthase [Caerostris extrusa]|uniref:Fatty acid synthase n=1 Tax=Caerostris extrusa TaxID=172846 RepID=A0AAV4M669_CAEEX|nr:fatty acid synthase [Caerostris extrusa]